jgi:hypothetical protein
MSVAVATLTLFTFSEVKFPLTALLEMSVRILASSVVTAEMSEAVATECVHNFECGKVSIQSFIRYL